MPVNLRDGLSGKSLLRRYGGVSMKLSISAQSCMSPSWSAFKLSEYKMISRTPKIEQARAIEPSLAVFSRKCGVSLTMDPGIATESLGSTRSVLSGIYPAKGRHSVKDESYCVKQHS